MNEFNVSDLVPTTLLYGGELIRDSFSNLDKNFEDFEDANEEFSSEDDSQEIPR